MRTTSLSAINLGEPGSTPGICVLEDCASKTVKAGQFKMSVGTIFDKGGTSVKELSDRGIKALRLNFAVTTENIGSDDVVVVSNAPGTSSFGSLTLSVADWAKSSRTLSEVASGSEAGSGSVVAANNVMASFSQTFVYGEYSYSGGVATVSRLPHSS